MLSSLALKSAALATYGWRVYHVCNDVSSGFTKMSLLTFDDEARLRELAAGLAKGVEDPELLLTRLGFTSADYEELSQTRTFRNILNQAMSEWEGAGNTHKRIKLKAAINIEQALSSFYHAMVDGTEPLSSRVKAFEAVARVGGLGNPELVPQGAGQYFKLEINLGAGKAPLVLENVSAEVVEYGSTDDDAEDAPPPYSVSKLWDGIELEPL